MFYSKYVSGGVIHGDLKFWHLRQNMILGFKRKLPNIGLYFYGSPLEKVKAFTFLGVWFEEHTTWAVHVGKIVDRCESFECYEKSGWL